jgi:sugar phosphate isomerase/epimerase
MQYTGCDMYLTGFADEAAGDIEGQVRATRLLGWKDIESRTVNGKMLHDIPDADFDHVCDVLAAAGIQVNCLGSAIANWGKSILDPMDQTRAELDRAIPRMKRLGTRLVRIMSFAVLKDRGPDDQMEQERFARLREIVRRFQDEGMTPVHENCMNYGGMGWPYTLRLIEQVPGLKLVFDTGNPVFTDDMTRPEPRPKQSAWEFYQHVRGHIAYVHIKDGIWDAAAQKTNYTFPGEGHGDVRRIVADLLHTGYDGGFSMEPHLAAVAHDASVTSPAEIKFANYVEYGRRFERLLTDIRQKG